MEKLLAPRLFRAWAKVANRQSPALAMGTSTSSSPALLAANSRARLATWKSNPPEKEERMALPCGEAQKALSLSRIVGYGEGKERKRVYELGIWVLLRA